MDTYKKSLKLPSESICQNLTWKKKIVLKIFSSWTKNSYSPLAEKLQNFTFSKSCVRPKRKMHLDQWYHDHSFFCNFFSRLSFSKSEWKFSLGLTWNKKSEKIFNLSIFLNSMSFNKDESQSNDCVLHLIWSPLVLEIFEISSPLFSLFESSHLERESKKNKILHSSNFHLMRKMKILWDQISKFHDSLLGLSWDILFQSLSSDFPSPGRFSNIPLKKFFFLIFRIWCHPIDMTTTRMMVSHNWWDHSWFSENFFFLKIFSFKFGWPYMIHLVPWAKLQNFTFSKPSGIWKRKISLDPWFNLLGTLMVISRDIMIKALLKFCLEKIFSFSKSSNLISFDTDGPR